ncbi:MAG: hypothetical protein B7Y88_02720 [Sphingomonadales bacterium 32-64-17]|nr:MAG: hypothetical protein B7Y88_02720 [Sphingomonadales bacterium 32-64-17]
MSMLDGILKTIAGSPDDVVNLAAKVGIDPAMAEKAIAALGQAHTMQGDTVELASAKTGLDTGTLSQIVEQIGGEGSLTEFANAIKNDPGSIAHLLDRDGDGNPLNDVVGMAKGLFNKG